MRLKQKQFIVVPKMVATRVIKISKRTGSSFSKRKVNLVYGGTDKGLMGVLAHSAFGKDTKVAEIIDKKFKS